MSELSIKNSKKTAKPSSNYLLGIFIVLAAVAGFYAPQIFEKWQTQPQTNIDRSQYCALSTQTCQQKNVSITLDTDIAKPLQETHIHVEWPENSSDKLMLTLRGLEMDIGIVKFPVLKKGDGNYAGIVILPICTYTKMTWIGTISDQNGKTVYASIRMEK